MGSHLESNPPLRDDRSLSGGSREHRHQDSRVRSSMQRPERSTARDSPFLWESDNGLSGSSRTRRFWCVLSAPRARTFMIRAESIPLIHPRIFVEFPWAGRVAAVHAQRKESGSPAIHPDWYYLRLPDGTFHEVQFRRLRKILEHIPEYSCCRTIAICLEKEFHQSDERLLQICEYCGL